MDAGELAALTPVKIGRREGLTGQRIIVLEDALRSDRNLFLRFRVLRGAATKVVSVKWEAGDVPTCAQAIDGKDLRLVVQLPRQRVSKKTRVEVRLSEGGPYTFALSSPWFSSFLSSLFE